jgi:Hsp70 protein.
LLTGKYQINDVKPGPDNASQKVTVKVRVNMDGVIGVIAASMVEKVENSGDTESMDVENTEEENGQKQEAGSENTENKAEKTQEGQSEVIMCFQLFVPNVTCFVRKNI